MSLKHKLEKAIFKLRGAGTCRELESFAYDFLEEKLDTKTQQKIKKHMKLCPPCEEFIVSYRRTKELGQRDQSPPLSPEFKDHLKKIYSP